LAALASGRLTPSCREVAHDHTGGALAAGPARARRPDTRAGRPAPPAGPAGRSASPHPPAARPHLPVGLLRLHGPVDRLPPPHSARPVHGGAVAGRVDRLRHRPATRTGGHGVGDLAETTTGDRR